MRRRNGLVPSGGEIFLCRPPIFLYDDPDLQAFFIRRSKAAGEDDSGGIDQAVTVPSAARMLVIADPCPLQFLLAAGNATAERGGSI